MKLKSKLIATIVSMCAAIAVMGVGVWASTSQSFQVTVKNDIDVKILSVDADIYGEFAVYSQFIGHTEDGKTNTFAQYYQNTNTGAQNTDGSVTFSDRYQKDHGYLLYASDQGGYNDGKDGVTEFYPATGGKWYDTNVNAKYGTGYFKYISEAKQHVYFATARSAGVDNDGDGAITKVDGWNKDYQAYAAEDLAKANGEGKGLSDVSFEKPENWAEYCYNVDYTTHVAQITYMYTIRQWKKASAAAATNAIDFMLTDGTNENLNQKLTNAAGNAGVYIDAYITRATDLNTDADESGEANTVVNGAGATTTAEYVWHEISLEHPTSIPSSEVNETYYIVLTYTFARNSANLDLESLSDAVQHRLVMASEGELTKATEFTTGVYAEEAQDYDTGTAVRLNYATHLSATAGGTTGGVVSEHGYNIVGSEFHPTFSPERALSTMTQDQRSTTFAAYTSATDNLTHSNILGLDNTAGRASNAPRGGYIFASAAGENHPILNEDTDTDYHNSNGSTAWYVKQLVEGNTVPAYTHTTHTLNPETGA